MQVSIARPTSTSAYRRHVCLGEPVTTPLTTTRAPAFQATLVSDVNPHFICSLVFSQMTYLLISQITTVKRTSTSVRAIRVNTVPRVTIGSSTTRARVRQDTQVYHPSME